MIVDSADNISILSQENTNLSEFIKSIENQYDNLKHYNLIVNLLNINAVTSQEMAEFLLLSNNHREINKSFVLVSDDMDYDVIPEELVVVPTLQEAHDMIEMESIERDLGL